MLYRFNDTTLVNIQNFKIFSFSITFSQSFSYIGYKQSNNQKMKQFKITKMKLELKLLSKLKVESQKAVKEHLEKLNQFRMKYARRISSDGMHQLQLTVKNFNYLIEGLQRINNDIGKLKYYVVTLEKRNKKKPFRKSA